jgi:hypothetical protein
MELITLYSARTGKKIRKVTKVTLPGGCVVTFTETLPRRLAIPQAMEVCRKRSGP